MDTIKSWTEAITETTNQVIFYSIMLPLGVFGPAGGIYNFLGEHGWSPWFSVPLVIVVGIIIFVLMVYLVLPISAIILYYLILIPLTLLMFISRILAWFSLPAIGIGLCIYLSILGLSSWISIGGVIYLVLAVLLTTVARWRSWRIWGVNGLFGYVLGVILVVTGLVEHFINPA